MVESNALLKRHTGNCIEGSNPSLSAPLSIRDLRSKEGESKTFSKTLSAYVR